MTAGVTLSDIGMAAMFIVAVLAAISAVIWAVLRHDKVIGPLARRQQEHEIELHRVESVLAAKKAEAQIAYADAGIIEAKAKASEAMARANEAELARMDRQLTRGKENGQ